MSIFHKLKQTNYTKINKGNGIFDELYQDYFVKEEKMNYKRWKKNNNSKELDNCTFQPSLNRSYYNFKNVDQYYISINDSNEICRSNSSIDVSSQINDRNNNNLKEKLKLNQTLKNSQSERVLSFYNQNHDDCNDNWSNIKIRNCQNNRQINDMYINSNLKNKKENEFDNYYLIADAKSHHGNTNLKKFFSRLGTNSNNYKGINTSSDKNPNKIQYKSTPKSNLQLNNLRSKSINNHNHYQNYYSNNNNNNDNKHINLHNNTFQESFKKNYKKTKKSSNCECFCNCECNCHCKCSCPYTNDKRITNRTINSEIPNSYRPNNFSYSNYDIKLKPKTSNNNINDNQINKESIVNYYAKSNSTFSKIKTNNSSKRNFSKKAIDNDKFNLINDIYNYDYKSDSNNYITNSKRKLEGKSLIINSKFQRVESFNIIPKFNSKTIISEPINNTQINSQKEFKINDLFNSKDLNKVNFKNSSSKFSSKSFHRKEPSCLSNTTEKNKKNQINGVTKYSHRDNTTINTKNTKNSVNSNVTKKSSKSKESSFSKNSKFLNVLTKNEEVKKINMDSIMNKWNDLFPKSKNADMNDININGTYIKKIVKNSVFSSINNNMISVEELKKNNENEEYLYSNKISINANENEIENENENENANTKANNDLSKLGINCNLSKNEILKTKENVKYSKNSKTHIKDLVSYDFSKKTYNVTEFKNRTNNSLFNETLDSLTDDQLLKLADNYVQTDESLEKFQKSVEKEKKKHHNSCFQILFKNK